MQPRHRLASVLLLGLALAAGALRLIPQRIVPTPACSFPAGITLEHKMSVICLGAPRAPLTEILARLGKPDCAINGWIQSGELLRVEDGCALTIQPLPGAHRLTLGLPLDLNLATEADLMALPRIGPVLAKRIVTDRQRRGSFTAISDLQRVRGIGPATLKRLQPWIMTSTSPRPIVVRASSSPR